MCWEVYRYVCMRLDTNIDRPFERAYTSQVVETAPSTAAHSRHSRLRYKLYMFSCVRAPPLFESFFENKSFAGDSFTCVTWLIHTCDMTHSHVWHDSFTCVTWLIYTGDMTHSHVWHNLFTRVAWLMSHVCHGSFTRVKWLIHKSDITYLHVWHDSFTRVSWLIHTCVMTHSHAWNDSSIRATQIITRVTWLIHMCHMIPWDLIDTP